MKEPSREKQAAAATDTASPNDTAVCGVIMPIAGNEAYSDEHWRRVQRIILKAIDKAGMQTRLVWENPEVDVIHSRILQNIYECDVIVCDVSGLNPNVMLELGLRLSTKRPTVVITDGETKPPFDLAVFQYHQYQRDLEYNSLDDFIDDLSEKINQVHISYKNEKYKSFVENFTFQVVEPTEVSVPAEEALRIRLDSISQQMKRIEMRLSADSSPRHRERPFSAPIKMVFDCGLVSSQIPAVLAEIKARKGVIEATAQPQKPFGHIISVLVSPGMPTSDASDLNSWISALLERLDEDVPF